MNIPADVTELALDAGNPKAASCRPARCRRAPTSARPAMAARARRQGDHPHRYLFTVFAVGADKLQVTADTSAAVVGFKLHFNTLAKAAIMGLFKR